METLLGALGIFALRIIDVSFATMRIMMLQRGLTWRAAGLAFFESLTWVIAAAAVFNSLDSPVRIFFFAAGFAAGTVVGVTVERWIAVGTSLVRIITQIGTPEVAEALRAAGFWVTVVNAQGFEGDVRIAFSATKRRRVPEMLEIVRAVNPDAFVTVEDTSTPELRYRRRMMVRV